MVVEDKPSIHAKCVGHKNPKVDTHLQESNSGPHGCEADALPNNYGNHTEDQHFLLNFVLQKRLNEYLLIYRR